jgi:hypothetical protein
MYGGSIMLCHLQHLSVGWADVQDDTNTTYSKSDEMCINMEII